MMKETDLFKPVRALFFTMGYDVQGEVGAADMFGVKDQETVVIELKLAMSLKLIYQAIERQKIADNVYIALPKRAFRSHEKLNTVARVLLKRLGIGLILVSQDQAEIELEATHLEITSTKRSSRIKGQMLKEHEKRETHLAIGGTNQERVTAYKEKVIEIAKALHTLGEASTSLIKEYTRIEKSQDILAKNYSGWFEKTDRKTYKLSEKGLVSLHEFLF